jgi:predicted dehydrogenase
MRHVNLTIAFQTNYSPSLAVMKGLIRSGEIGEVLEIRGRGKEDHRGGGEDLWVLGSHVMNLMRYFGGDPVDCYATVFHRGKPVTKMDVIEGNEGIGPLAGDHVQATYTFADGVTGYFASHRNRGTEPSRFGVQIFGSKGIADVQFGYPAACYLLRDPAWCPRDQSTKWLPVTSNGIDQPETIKESGVEAGNVVLVNDFVKSIANRRQPVCTMYDARWTVEMIAAVFESHRLHQPVRFPLSQRENPLTKL